MSRQTSTDRRRASADGRQEKNAIRWVDVSAEASSHCEFSQLRVASRRVGGFDEQCNREKEREIDTQRREHDDILLVCCWSSTVRAATQHRERGKEDRERARISTE